MFSRLNFSCFNPLLTLIRARKGKFQWNTTTILQIPDTAAAALCPAALLKWVAALGTPSKLTYAHSLVVLN